MELYIYTYNIYIGKLMFLKTTKIILHGGSLTFQHEHLIINL